MNSEEYGSCQSSSDCAYRTPAQPYCSAFGYCTQVHETQANLPKKFVSHIFLSLRQITQYGADGCTPCHGHQ